MHRRAFLALLPAAPLALSACTRDSAAGVVPEGDPISPLRLSRAEWRRLLPPDAYAVLFEEATEPPFSSPLDRERRRGTYVCAACSLPLFTSEAKYDSGTGWPSFTRPIPGRLNTKADHALAEARTEYHCARCGGHQGHVFDDGPRPTGQRWCNNGLALRFIPASEPLPPLRTR